LDFIAVGMVGIFVGGLYVWDPDTLTFLVADSTPRLRAICSISYTDGGGGGGSHGGGVGWYADLGPPPDGDTKDCSDLFSGASWTQFPQATGSPSADGLPSII
jgi:hypothetical protein